MTKVWICPNLTLATIVLGSLLSLGFQDRTATAAVRVAVYGFASSPFADRIASLGYNPLHWSTTAQVNAASLATVDVLFVHSTYAYQLADKASQIAEWVAEGNGLIVEQPNISGPVSIMPPGLSITVASREYDGSHSAPDPIRNVVLTPAGFIHPITIGLTSDDICQNGDRVLSSAISPLFDVLGVQGSNPDYVALAAANYGSGRVFFHTGNTNPGALTPGSDLYIRRMIDWAAAVPEPTAFVLLGSSFTVLLSVRRRSRYSICRKISATQCSRPLAPREANHLAERDGTRTFR